MPQGWSTAEFGEVKISTCFFSKCYFKFKLKSHVCIARNSIAKYKTIDVNDTQKKNK